MNIIVIIKAIKLMGLHGCQLSQFQWDTHDIRALSRVPPNELLEQRLVPLELHFMHNFANSVKIIKKLPNFFMMSLSVTMTRAGDNLYIPVPKVKL